jgi:MFS family permease
MKPSDLLPSPPRLQPASTRWALAALTSSMLLSSLGASIANVMLPTLAQTLGHAVQWVALAYLLGVTTSTVVVGRLGDLVGRRRALVGGLLLFIAAAALSGLAPSLGLLTAARGLQGVGAAAMMALTLSFVGGIVPQERTGMAMGLLGTTSAIGTALGPSIGGALAAQLGWQAVFLAQVPAGLLALGLSLTALPADRAPSAKGARFDHAGALWLTLAIAAWTLAMTLGRGESGWIRLGWLLAAGVGGVGFFMTERRASAPLVDLDLLGDRDLFGGLLMSLLVSAVLMATLVVGPFYLSLALGLSAGTVGMVMSAGPLAAALTGLPAGRLVDRLGTRRTTLAGLGGIGLGTSLLAVVPEAAGSLGYVLPIVVMTASYALFQAANNTSVLRDRGPSRRGVVSGLLTLSRNLGLVTGASAMGAVFNAASGHPDLTLAPAADVAAAMRFTFALAAGGVGAALLVARSRRASAAPSPA